MGASAWGERARAERARGPKRSGGARRERQNSSARGERACAERAHGPERSGGRAPECQAHHYADRSDVSPFVAASGGPFCRFVVPVGTTFLGVRTHCFYPPSDSGAAAIACQCTHSRKPPAAVPFKIMDSRAQARKVTDAQMDAFRRSANSRSVVRVCRA